MENLEYSNLGPIQLCPYHKSVIVWLFRLSHIVLGTVGLINFNVWVAGLYLIYSIVFTFWAWPVKHCEHCYYSVAKIDTMNGRTVKKLLPLDEWKEFELEKHVACGKNLFPPLGFLLWLLPIVLIGISLFLNFSIIPLLSLIGFIVGIGGMFGYVRLKVCPVCAIMEECHAAF
ncbi:MAG: hypothetical protein GY870_13720 [archaeon]|nr:hypothetical protein [archaeon]